MKWYTFTLEIHSYIISEIVYGYFFFQGPVSGPLEFIPFYPGDRVEVFIWHSLRASSPIWGSLARTCERGAEGPFPCPSLARSRETGFAPPNRRACSQANMAKFPARLSRSRFEKPRSRQPSQPALSYKHIENFTKNLEIRRDLGNRASPVNRAHVKMPVGTLRRILGRL